MSRNYFMVRAMDSTDPYFKVFFDKSVVAVGWSNVDFTKFEDSSKLREAVYNSYYIDNAIRPQDIAKKLNQVERFKGIKSQDYIIVPFNSYIVLAIAEEEEYYEEGSAELDISNQRKVTYIKKDGELLKIPRSELKEGLQRRLRVPGSSVSNLFDFRDEIDRLFSSETYNTDIQKRESERAEQLKISLLDRIQNGATNLQAGGYSLEVLVCELMKIEGYDSRILSKRKFPDSADADIEAVKNDAFSSTKIYVQVKHHRGTSSQEGIQQIINATSLTEYEDYEGWFITTAKVSSEDLQYANNNGIQVMQGEDLIDLIISNVDKLDDKTKKILGISQYPCLIDI